jgi:hypothetical protein
MKKKGYGARKRRDNFKSKDYVRRCYKCKSKDHIVVDCPYNSDKDEDEKKKEKKEKKENKEKKMTFNKKKKGGGYVVAWDSDGSLENDSSDEDNKSLKKALASIVINKPSIFDTPSTCFMTKPTKVKYDVSDNDDCESDNCRSDNEQEYTKEELMDTQRRSSWTYWSKSTLALR